MADNNKHSKNPKKDIAQTRIRTEILRFAKPIATSYLTYISLNLYLLGPDGLVDPAQEDSGSCNSAIWVLL